MSYPLYDESTSQTKQGIILFRKSEAKKCLLSTLVKTFSFAEIFLTGPDFPYSQSLLTKEDCFY